MRPTLIAACLFVGACDFPRHGLGEDVDFEDAGADVASDVPSDVSKTDTADADAATCTDRARNGDETDVDCGGATCPGCGVGQACAAPSDCLSSVCSSAKCVAQPCANGTTDGAETDVDCGGGMCARCRTGKTCKIATDCDTGVCGLDNRCAAPSCTDGAMNGPETDIDCGGGCPAPCSIGKGCLVTADCDSLSCVDKGTAKACAAQRSCKTLHDAAGGAVKTGIYTIDPDGPAGPNPPFAAFCDMLVDGGGWTYFAHVNQDYLGGNLFAADVGSYRSDRADDNTTYSLGASVLAHIDHTNMMVTLDEADPIPALASKKFVIFGFALGSTGFSKGPIPCVGLNPFQYRLALTGPMLAGFSGSQCDGVGWDTRDVGNLGFLTLFIQGFPYGNFWGGGMGGNDTWNHDGYWYAR